MASAQQELEQGQLLQQAGRWPDARRCYERALQLEPANSRTWFLLGTLALAERDPVEAVNRFQRAIAFQPTFPDAYYHLGIALQVQGQNPAAAAAHQQAVALRPDHLDAWCNLAVALQAQGKFGDAIAAYRRALSLRPAFAEVHCNLGNALQATHDLPAAIAAYREALRLKPEFAEAHNSLGVALKAQGKLDEAIVAYRAALAIKPDYLSALVNVAIALKAQEKWADAIAASRRALELSPDHAPALLNLGGALQGAGNLAAALDCYRQILQRQPKHTGALSNLGVVLQAQGKIDEAMTAYRRTLELEPDNVEALTNLGTAHQARNDPDAAIASYQRAIAVRPDLAQAHFNEAVCQLVVGNFSAGWAKYEYRWQCEQRKSKRVFPQPLWLGDRPLAGQTILVYPEQGLGDTLQFVRYLPYLVARGATVVLEVQPPLQTLLASLPSAASVVSRGQPLPAFDLHCPLLSLPLAFSTTLETIPAAVPYLRASADKIARWHARVDTRCSTPRARKIGVVWSGGSHHKSDHLRSIPFEQFARIADGLTAQFFCLQKELKESDAPLLAARPEIVALSAEIGDFADTAAIIEQMDLVISVDTSVAHLAGALGKPTWILLPFAPDWRWMLNRLDSPWYPTAKLFRQPAPGDWNSVLTAVQRELTRWQNEVVQ